MLWKIQRAPKSLDEALCIALRLEAWAKSADRSDRGRQKVRFAAKPEPPKKTSVPESDDRLTRIESEMSKVQNELKKLTAKPQAPKGNGNSSNPQWRGPVPRVSDLAGGRHQPLNPPTYPQWQGPVPGVAHSPGGRHLPLAPQVTEVQSTTPTPVMNYSQSRNGSGGESRSRTYPYQYQPVTCWTCNLPGHISRNCPQLPLVWQIAGPEGRKRTLHLTNRTCTLLWY